MTFIQSDLYLEIAEAEQIYRELPFVVNQAKLIIYQITMKT